MFKIIIGMLILASIAYFLAEKMKALDSGSGAKSKSKKERENIGKYYYLKKSFFTYREKPFFDELMKQNEDQFVILSKVRMEDIVGVAKGIEKNKYNPMRNHIKSRHVDFAILNKEGKILAVIEVDDKSHETEKAKVGDGYKNDIFEFVGVKFFRVRVGETYAGRINSIFTKIKGA
jgi:hypothetical protein